MKTYLVMYFGTTGVSCTDVAKHVEAIGFKTLFGPYDFVFDWPRKPTKDEILALGDKVVKSLRGSGAVFNLDTHD